MELAPSSDPSKTYSFYHKNVKSQPAPASETQAKWVCQVCGYEYDGANVPDDFICPICKHGKVDFILQA